MKGENETVENEAVKKKLTIKPGVVHSKNLTHDVYENKCVEVWLASALLSPMRWKIKKNKHCGISQKKNQTQNIEKHTRTRYAANNISERFMTYFAKNSTMKVAKQLSLARSNRGIDCLAWLKSMGGRWACEEALTNFCAGL